MSIKPSVAIKIFMALALLIGFGFLYGLFISSMVSTVGSTDSWIYVVLAVPIIIPIVDFIISKNRPRYLDLLKELVLGFIAAVIVVLIFSNYQFGGDYKNYIMSFVGLILVLGLTKGIDMLVTKYILRR